MLCLMILFNDFFFDGPFEGWDQFETEVGIGLDCGRMESGWFLLLTFCAFRFVVNARSCIFDLLW